jgi:hypothetical protein
VSAVVAIATCSPTDIDPDQPLLLAALARIGVTATAVAWDDDTVNWDQFDMTVLRSTWDYAPRRREFLAWARNVPRLHNPYPVIEQNSDKHYLEVLAQSGSRVIATQFVDVGVSPQFPSGSFVVKPTVGAGSLDTERYDEGHEPAALAHVKRLHAAGRDVIVQPYVNSVDTLGEMALIFIDGEFAHAMNKGAMLNIAASDRDFLFRAEQMRPVEVNRDVIAVGEAALSQLGASDLLYARVDLVSDNGWAIMEVELTEPSLFLSSRPAMADRLADAIKRRLRN